MTLTPKPLMLGSPPLVYLVKPFVDLIKKPYKSSVPCHFLGSFPLGSALSLSLKPSSESLHACFPSRWPLTDVMEAAAASVLLGFGVQGIGLALRAWGRVYLLDVSRKWELNRTWELLSCPRVNRALL